MFIFISDKEEKEKKSKDEKPDTESPKHTAQASRKYHVTIEPMKNATDETLRQEFDLNFKRFVSEVPVDNKSSLVQVMAWHQTGNKPLPKTTMTKFVAMQRH